MRYPLSAHIINFLFIGMFATVPIIYCLKNTSISEETIGLILFFTFLFGVLIFADWYHIYFTNTYKSIAFAFILGVVISTICLISASIINGRTMFELLSLNIEAWKGSRFFMRFFVTGAGIAVCAIYSIPRLFLIRIFTNAELPGCDIDY